VKRLVVDAGVIASWFGPNGAARHLREEYEAGSLVVIGPSHLPDEVLQHLDSLEADDLARVASELRRLGFELQRPPVRELARWVHHGLPSHRAAYLALASHLDLALATDDPELLSASPAARPSDRA
jgi:predicted nucleic acid-binding protein